MRCTSCNTNLNDFESTRKDEYNNYIDLCSDCYNEAYDDNLLDDDIIYEPIDNIGEEDIPWFLKEQAL